MEYAAKIDRDALEDRLKTTVDKCLVAGCTNHKNKGKFIGDLCSPCHTMLTQGKKMPSDAWFAKQWVGLTGTEINRICAANVGYPERMMKEVENLLKEKNA
jgi:hypothetical protein